MFHFFTIEMTRKKITARLKLLFLLIYSLNYDMQDREW